MGRSKKIYPIKTKDCTVFDDEHNYAITWFMHNHSNDVRIIDLTGSSSDREPLALFNYSDKRWWAGRYVGEATFQFKKNYTFKIVPRFGNVFLLRLLEEIFNIKLVQSSQRFDNNDTSEIIKQLIPYIWLQKLSKANMHGLPRLTFERMHCGTTIKGKIDIRATAKSLLSSGKAVSKYRQKEMDHVIVAILAQARNILTKGYSLNERAMKYATISTTDILSHLDQYRSTTFRVSEKEYQNIRYGTIYQGYKDVVDFSWQIIKNKNVNQSQRESTAQVYGLFLDIAELWEAYLRSLIRRHFSASGWKVDCRTEPIYENKSFETKLIPDIVMEKDGQIVVWDAKYKMMKHVRNDYDRSDFHQIHTYMYYYQQKTYNQLIGGGLLYPLVNGINSESLPMTFGLEHADSFFYIDGIDMSDLEGNEKETQEERQKKYKIIQQKEKDFLERLEHKVNK